MTEWYEEIIEKFSIQSLITCAVMTNIYESDKTIEVACGPGRHTEILAQNFMKKGSILVACDFSEKMVEKLK